MGGKTFALDTLRPLFPEVIREYREPMIGGGSVYFHVRHHNLAKRYWIADIARNLIVFWKTAQDPDMCKLLVDRLREIKGTFSPEDLKLYFKGRGDHGFGTQVEYAAQYFVRNRCSYSGTTEMGGFSSDASRKRFTESSIDRLARMPEALKDTHILWSHYDALLQAPGKDVFVFLDPPYPNTSNLYKHHDFDHDRLAEKLRKTKHKFLLTYPDTMLIRTMYRWANLHPFNLKYGSSNVGGVQSRDGDELAICNYDC